MPGRKWHLRGKVHVYTWEKVKYNLSFKYLSVSVSKVKNIFILESAWYHAMWSGSLKKNNRLHFPCLQQMHLGHRGTKMIPPRSCSWYVAEVSYESQQFAHKAYARYPWELGGKWVNAIGPQNTTEKNSYINISQEKVLAAPFFSGVNTGQWVSVLPEAHPKKLPFGSALALVILRVVTQLPFSLTSALHFPPRGKALINKQKFLPVCFWRVQRSLKSHRI